MSRNISDGDYSNKDIRKLKVDISVEKKEYDILIGANSINYLTDYIEKVHSGKKVFLVTDKNVMNLYGEKVSSLLLENDYDITTYIVPAGEKSKSYESLLEGHNLLLENNFRRDNLIIALGGGVVGDLAGFIAATFMRGVSFIQIPTTLLAQVDSSVGGKTAINHPAGKNLVGAFHQPDLVLIDPVFLKTLSLRELKTGLAEVIKHGFIADRELLDFLQNNHEKILAYDIEAFIYIIYKSCLIKSAVVNQDEKEQGRRALLNFGHTIGHALEAVADYKKYNHGEAVAVGMIGAGKISYKKGNIDKESCEYIGNLIEKYGLPLRFQYNENCLDVFDRLFFDKKVKKNKLRWILLEEMGKAVIDIDVDQDIIKEVLEELKCVE